MSALLAPAALSGSVSTAIAVFTVVIRSLVFVVASRRRFP